MGIILSTRIYRKTDGWMEDTVSLLLWLMRGISWHRQTARVMAWVNLTWVTSWQFSRGNSSHNNVGEARLYNSKSLEQWGVPCGIGNWTITMAFSLPCTPFFSSSSFQFLNCINWWKLLSFPSDCLPYERGNILRTEYNIYVSLPD